VFVDRDGELVLLSEVINRHIAFGRGAPPVNVTEAMLTFECLRCGRALSAAETVVARSPSAIAYLCPHDEATLVTIHPRDYQFTDGDLTIRVGDEEVPWWDFARRRDQSNDTSMFERFTERARRVVVHAQEQSRSLGHDYIGTEHLLLGLTCEEDWLAARALKSVHVTHERVRAAIVRAVGEGEQAGTGQIPFTPRAKKVLEMSLREALRLGDNYIGTEHILLGLLREDKGPATDVLRDLDADVEKVRDELLRLRAETPSAEPHDVELDVQDLDLTPRVRQLLMEAAAGARDARRAEVDERDLLEAMLADQSIARVLSGLGVDVSTLRERLPHIGWSEPDAPDRS
jgi:hypothetical protein